MDYNAEDLQKIIEQLRESNPELYALAQVESSGGKNLKHELIDSGLNKGTRAGGAFGITPLEAQEIIKREGLSEEYPDVLQGTPDDITNILNYDPELSEVLAKKEFERRKNVLGGDAEKAAYSWLHGVTGAKRTPNEQMIESKRYQDYQKALPFGNIRKMVSK